MASGSARRHRRIQPSATLSDPFFGLTKNLSLALARLRENLLSLLHRLLRFPIFLGGNNFRILAADALRCVHRSATRLFLFAGAVVGLCALGTIDMDSLTFTSDPLDVLGQPVQSSIEPEDERFELRGEHPRVYGQTRERVTIVRDDGII